MSHQTFSASHKYLAYLLYEYVYWSSILDKFTAKDFNATRLSTYYFSTLYTTLLHKLIKDKLIERTLNREGSLYLACNDSNTFITSENPKKHRAWACQNVCDALNSLLDNNFIRFGTKLYRQVVVRALRDKK